MSIERFGRAIARPSIEASGLSEPSWSAPGLAEQLLGPPLKPEVGPLLPFKRLRVWPSNCSALH